MERVHRELLAERLPPALVTRRIWEERFSDINAFVRHPRAQRHCMIVISSTLAVGPIAILAGHTLYVPVFVPSLSSPGPAGFRETRVHGLRK